jgi:hypothetical protein
VWLCTGRRSAWLAGALYVASAFALVVGLVLLPSAAWGLLVLVGFLGLVPFPAAFVYLRNAVRAAPLAASLWPIACGALLFSALPLGVCGGL